jgi:hypothetical protein
MDVAALAALAGNALVTAAVTDAWEDTRHKVARLFGRGKPDPQIERRFDATREQLTRTPAAELELTRARQARDWQAWFSDLLADHPDAVTEVDALVAQISANAPAASGHSAAAGRDVNVTASGGGVAAAVIHGGVNTAGPTMPGSADG